jgi:hypothetical protein
MQMSMKNKRPNFDTAFKIGDQISIEGIPYQFY